MKQVINTVMKKYINNQKKLLLILLKVEAVNFITFVYHRCYCAKTLFGLPAFYCSQINSRTDLRSHKKDFKIIKGRYLQVNNIT